MYEEAKAHPGLYVELTMMMMMILMYNYNSALYKFAGSTFQKIKNLWLTSRKSTSTVRTRDLHLHENIIKKMENL